MNKEVTIYFDESGYTGENLLKEDQPTFSYASVCINSDDAEEIVSNIISKYKIQNGELKGVNLIRKEKGQRAILEILEAIKDKYKISVSDKKFALAGQIFEYIFEPILASKNLIFYNLNFHKFIANSLYIGFIVDDRFSKEIFIKFERLMRNKTLQDLEAIISILDEIDEESESFKFLKNIIEFIKIHKIEIYEEIKDLPKWTIELSITSLHALFSVWGENKDKIIAYCDNSKPIGEQKNIFNGMIDRDGEIIYSVLKTDEGKQIPLTYNLKSIDLVDSKIYKGVQLADVVATASAYSFQMFKDNNSEFNKKLQEILLPNVVYGSIFHDFDYINLEKKEVQLNAIILEEILERSRKNISILDEIEEYIIFMQKNLELNPIFR